MLDVAGAVAELNGIDQIFHYDAYGQAIGFVPSQAATEFLYSGEQFDAKIGQQYLRARYYDPATGRFNRLDPFFGNLNDPQSLHNYTYAHNDPVNGIDPSGLFISMLSGFLGSLAMRAYQAAPTVAAYGFTVTKISFLTYLGSGMLLELENRGWIPNTGSFLERVHALSGAIFIIGLTVTELALGMPQAHNPLPSGRSGQVNYGSTGLSKQCAITRSVNGIGVTQERGTGRNVTPNVASVMYRDSQGKTQTRTYISGGRVQGQHSHSERKMKTDLEAEGIPSDSVIEIYTELQPCNIPRPAAGCEAMLRRDFPNANITWSFQYGDANSRKQGMAELTNAVQSIQPQYLFNQYQSQPDPGVFYGFVAEAHEEVCYP